MPSQSDIQWALEEIRSSPEGPQVAAFFDFDGTLIDGYSAVVYLQERVKTRQMSLRELAATLYETGRMRYYGSDVSRLTWRTVGALAGYSLEQLNALGEELFIRRISRMIYPSVPALIEAHRAKGHTLVIASSAIPPQIMPAARQLNIPHVLATQVEVDNGLLTGRVAGPILWGPGKAEAVSALAAEMGIDLGQSFGYANGLEDVQFLERVGQPRPMNPDKGLQSVAQARGWPIIRLLRPKSIGVTTVLRSLAAYGGLASAISLGLITAAVRRRRRAGANLALSLGGDLALAAAGVRLRVIGGEHLWSARPAVFLFNHQSQLDVLILCSLLRRDFTAVSKIEAAHEILFAPLAYLAGFAYVDRSNHEQAVQALAPLQQGLHQATSVAIAPEGTRSRSRQILPFKRGAFHMAMQARVPVVPIVIRNAGQLMAPNSPFMAAGTVDVQVLEPIPTVDWNVADLDAIIADVRHRFLEAMAAWPT